MSLVSDGASTSVRVAPSSRTEPGARHGPWSPPTGDVAELLPAGVRWDAVSVPEEFAGGVRQRLGPDSGAILRDPTEHYETWFTDACVTQRWELPEATRVRLLSTAQCLWVPPLSVTRGPGTHWVRPWSADCGLTDPEPLLAALLGAVGEAGVSRVVVG